MLILLFVFSTGSIWICYQGVLQFFNENNLSFYIADYLEHLSAHHEDM